jgi:ferric-dicitrate binding protein FerR (iron transport regulator)
MSRLHSARIWLSPAAGAERRPAAADLGALLQGYLVSELGPADRDRFESWVAMDDARRLTVAALRYSEDRDGGTLWRGEADIEDWWAECREAMNTAGGQLVAGTVHLPEIGRELRIGMPGAVATRWWQVPAPWAALAASILCASLGLWAVHSGHAGPAGDAGVAEHAYTTARGERAVVTLDGATVVLGPESVLRISGSYGVRDRTVSLTGHGYFDVAPDATHPFRVWANGILTKDIGTRFDLRAYPNESATRLIVAEGAVAIQTRAAGLPAAPVLLTRGMMGTTGADGVVQVRSAVAADRYLAWSDGRLTFEDTPLPEAAAEIGRWYDLDIQLGDARLASKMLTATFDDPPAAVLVALEGALGVRATRAGRVVTLYPP